MAKRIMATIVGDFTNYTKTVDVTTAILSLPASQRAALRDNDITSDALAPDALIGVMRDVFHAIYGEETATMEFGFTVYVEESIARYFGTP